MIIKRGYACITRFKSNISMQRMKKYCWFIMLLIPLCGLFFIMTVNTSTNNNTLKLVHILFRHGERSPLESYPLDPHKGHKWPGGWNQLSNKGKDDEYTLGLQLASRYRDFLPKVYDLNDILVESSYADRCIMSAQLVLAGLYPPIREQIWNANLLWQPIPVHSIPRFLDNKIALKKDCPRFKALLAEAHASERIRKMTEDNKALFRYLTEQTGYSVQNISTLETLYNTLEIEQLNGLALPEWTKAVFPRQMKDLAASSLAIYTETESMKRIHGGFLVKEILEHVKGKVDGSLKPDRLMFLYSGHDLTVVSLLRVLGFHELVKPEFGASVIIELHEIADNFEVKFLYKANPTAEAKNIVLEKCGNPCPVDKLYEALNSVVPSDWEKECS